MKTRFDDGKLLAAICWWHGALNDLGAIRQLAKDLQQAQGVARDPQALSKAQSAVDLASRLCKQAARLRGRRYVKREPVDLRRTVRQALRRVRRPQIITWETHIPPNLPRVLAHEPLLLEVFVNLLQNAVNAMPGGGVLRIDAEVSGANGARRVALRVQDTGIGLEAGGREDVFERGLGLWWSRAYVELLGGDLTAEASPGPGVAFVVRLPLSALAG